jgi:nicotinamide-nucleotide amidase
VNLELVTVGTELLLGFTVDTNSAEIARRAGAIGVRVVRRTSVGDTDAEIGGAVLEALGRTGAVLSTGGLGPTSDDVTKTAVAAALGLPLRFADHVWDDLLERYQGLGRTPSPSNRTQAMVPEGAVVLRNRWGTAPGLWIESPRGLVIMLPGVPREMRMLLEHEVLPRLAERAGGRVVRSRTVRTTAIPESTLADRLGDVEQAVAPATLAYLPGVEGVDLRLTVRGLESDESDRVLERAAAEVVRRAGEFVYALDESSLAERLVDALRTRGRRVAVAESCTGGLIGGRITDVPGSSDVFEGGVIAYANAVKLRELGVPQELLDAHGAVSEPVACAMAEAARTRFGTAYGIGVTGIAGPGGGTAEKPVGLVWFAVAGPDGTSVHRSIFPGSREEIRARAAQTGLYLLYRRLEAAPTAAVEYPV